MPTPILETRSCDEVVDSGGREAGTSTAMAGFDSRSEVTSPRVEWLDRASARTRIAHSLLRGTVGLGLTTLTLACGGRQFEHLFRIGRLVDPVAAVFGAPKGTRRATVRVGQFHAEWLWHGDVADPRKRQDSVLLYFHGGGYFCGGLNTHRRLVAKIAQAGRMPAFNVGYRQLPEVHFTEILDDAVEAYRYLLERGFSADRIVVSGDSAGGGLAFRLALACRERGLPMPVGISAIAPWADFDSAIRNAHVNRHRDPYLPARGIELVARCAVAVDGRLDPSWSAVNHDFTGLPPVLIQVGSTECLLSDSERLVQRCAEARVPVRLQIWDRAPHVHHLGSDLIPDARDAIHELGKFHKEVSAGIFHRASTGHGRSRCGGITRGTRRVGEGSTDSGASAVL